MYNKVQPDTTLFRTCDCFPKQVYWTESSYVLLGRKEEYYISLPGDEGYPPVATAQNIEIFLQ
jgi:hypothetical protein